MSTGLLSYLFLGRSLTRLRWCALFLVTVVGRCSLTLSKLVLKGPMFQLLKLECDELFDKNALKFNLRRYTVGAITSQLAADGVTGNISTFTARPQTRARAHRHFFRLKYTRL